MSKDRFAARLQEWIELSMRRSMRTFLRYARQNNLSMSQMGALFHIYRQGQCGVTEVGHYLDVTSAAASQMIDRLVQQGLIERSEDPEDRRVKQIVLTKKGERILKNGMRARQRWMHDLAQALSDEEKAALEPALDLLIEKVRSLAKASERES